MTTCRFGTITTRALLVALCLGAPAAADDGVIEVNQAAALAGAFAGDFPGFPVTIRHAGTYRLTSDLVVPSGAPGISVVAEHVSLDLGGFSVRGPADCTPPQCPPTGSAFGITGPDGTTIAHGRILGMARGGVRLGDGSRVRDLVVRDNGTSGITVGAESIVENVQVLGNGGTGVWVGISSIVRSSLISRNTTGIVVGGGSARIENCAVNDNDIVGIAGGIASVIADSTINANQSNGISGRDLLIRDTMVAGNQGAGIQITNRATIAGTHTVANRLDGITCFNADTAAGCHVVDSTISDNGQRGLELITGGAYGSNLLQGNGQAAVSGGTPIAPNVCNGQPCP